MINRQRWYFGDKGRFVLFSGKAGVGKSTASKILFSLLIKRFPYLYAYSSSFAFGVKEVARTMNWDGIKNDRGRKLLQAIGNVGREYDPDTWVRYTVKELFRASGIGHAEDSTFTYFPSTPNFILIDDWRFPNEAEFIENKTNYGLVKIKVVAPERESLKNTQYYNDISEVSLDDFNNSYYDFIINNSGSKEELEKQINKIIDILVEKNKKGE